MRKTMSTAVVVAVLLVTSAVASASPITPTKILGGWPDQIAPIANANYFVWAQNRPSFPKRYVVFAQPFPLSAGLIQVNAIGSQGFPGSFLPGTDQIIYQQIARHDSDIKLFDIPSRTRTSPPAGINTDKWEWAPTASANYIEFGRDDPAKPASASRVLLYDRTTKKTITLGSEKLSCNCIWPYQVSDRYATWLDCVTVCRTYFYDTATGKTGRVPDPKHLDQYNPSIDGATGTIYFAQAKAPYCAKTVRIMRWTIGTTAPAVTVSVLPSGYDVASTTYVYVDPSGNDDVYFDRVKCSGSYYADIYEIPSAQTA